MIEYLNLIKSIIDEGVLRTPKIINAFKKVDRKDFVGLKNIKSAYLNAPLPIGKDQTISQPLTVAFMIELLSPEKGDKILEIGSGSAWQTAILAELVDEKGKIISIEIIKDLYEFAKNNLKKYKYKNIKLIYGDGSKGYKKEAPYDGIIAGSAAKEIPKEFLNQLKKNGKLIMPIGTLLQKIVYIKKINQNEFEEIDYPGFVFVPMKETSR